MHLTVPSSEPAILRVEPFAGDGCVQPPGMSLYDRYPSSTLHPDTPTHNTGFNPILRRSDKISSPSLFWAAFSGVLWQKISFVVTILLLWLYAIIMFDFDTTSQSTVHASNRTTHAHMLRCMLGEDNSDELDHGLSKPKAKWLRG